jgi:hypothetical protein
MSQLPNTPSSHRLALWAVLGKLLCAAMVILGVYTLIKISKTPRRGPQPVMTDQDILRCELIEARSSGLILYRAIITNTSDKDIVIDYTCHPFDSLDIVYFDLDGAEVARYDDYGQRFFNPAPGSLILRPQERYEHNVGIHGCFKLAGLRMDAVQVEVRFHYEELVIRSQRVLLKPMRT